MPDHDLLEQSAAGFAQMIAQCEGMILLFGKLSDGFDQSATAVPGLFEGNPCLPAAAARFEASLRGLVFEVVRFRASLAAMHGRGLEAEKG